MRTALSALILIGVALILSFPNAAIAQDSSNYVNLKLGGFFPSDDLDDADFDTGFTGEVAYGRYFCPYGAVEVGIGYYTTEMSYRDDAWPAPGYAKEENELTVIPFTFTVKGIYTFNRVELYGGLGGGLYFADIDGEVTISGYDDVSMKDDDTVAGFHVVLGANYNITDMIFLGVEGRSIWTEDAEFKDDFLGLPVSRETNLDGYMITGVVGFRF